MRRFSGSPIPIDMNILCHREGLRKRGVSGLRTTCYRNAISQIRVDDTAKVAFKDLPVVLQRITLLENQGMESPATALSRADDSYCAFALVGCCKLLAPIPNGPLGFWEIACWDFSTLDVAIDNAILRRLLSAR